MDDPYSPNEPTSKVLDAGFFSINNIANGDRNSDFDDHIDDIQLDTFNLRGVGDNDSGLKTPDNNLVMTFDKESDAKNNLNERLLNND